MVDGRDFEISRGGPDDDRLEGGPGRDRLFGFGGRDHLHGRGGDDVLSGGRDDDHLHGGHGFDRASYVDRNAAVRLDLAAGEAHLDAGFVLRNQGSTFEDQVGGGRSPADILAALRSGEGYVNVHSFRFPPGEIRGQLSEAWSKDGVVRFEADLDGGQQTPAPVDTPARGHAALEIDVEAGTYDFEMRVDGLDPGQLNPLDPAIDSGVHVHIAPVGANGPIALNPGNAALGGVIEPHVESDRLDGVENAAGSAFDDELRGDDGDNILWGQGGDDTLEGRGGDDRLIGGDGEDDIDGGAGFDRIDYRESAVGVDVSLGGGEASRSVGGTIRRTGVALEDQGGGGRSAEEIVASLRAGEGYVNVHTFAFPAGELRGQLALAEEEGSRLVFRAALDGGQEVPPIETPASGSAELVIDLAGGVYDFEVEFDQLDPEQLNPLNETINSGVHVHIAPAGANGPIALNPGNPEIAGAFESETVVETDSVSNVEAVVGSMAGDVLRGGSADNSLWGEDGDDVLWGQRGEDRLFGGAGDDQLRGGFGVDKLYGEAGDDSLRGGFADDRLKGGEGSDTVDYAPRATAFEIDLDAGYGRSVVGARLEARALAFEDQGGGGRSAEEIEAALRDGRAYVNVHSLDNAGGEIRGSLELVAEADGVLTFETRLSGENEVPAIESPAFGSARLEVDLHARTYDFGAEFTNLPPDRLNFLNEVINSPAHIHLGSPDENGPILLNPGNPDLGGRIVEVLETDRLESVENAIGTDLDDVIRGDEGDNRLEGRGGADALLGGAGDDVFVLSDEGGIDRVLDFALGHDRLESGGAPIAARIEGDDTIVSIEGESGSTDVARLIGVTSSDAETLLG